MIICETCIRVFDGTRLEARRSGWEPESTRSQWHLDHGPMMCPTCILALLDAVMEGLRNYTGPWPLSEL